MTFRENPLLAGVFIGLFLIACTACAGCTDLSETDADLIYNTSAGDSSLVHENLRDIVSASDSVSGVTMQTGTLKSAVKSASMVTQGEYIPVTLTAPYGDYLVVVSSSGIIPHGQIDVDTMTPPYTQNFACVHVGTSGKTTFSVMAVGTDDITITLLEE